MTNKLWKSVERKVAELLGGKRVPVHSTSGIKSDVDHEWLSIECKERQNPIRFLEKSMQQAVRNASENKLPIVVVHIKGSEYLSDYVILRLGDFRDWFVNEEVTQ